MKKYWVIILLCAGCIAVGCDKESPMDRPIGKEHLPGHLSPSVEQLTVDCNSQSIDIFFENTPNISFISVFAYAHSVTDSNDRGPGPLLYQPPQEGYIFQSDWYAVSFDSVTKKITIELSANDTEYIRQLRISYCVLCEGIYITQEPNPSAINK